MKANPLDLVLSRLRSSGIKPRSSGKDFTCRCPAHDDRSPSLSIGPGDDGRALVHCHAGCTPAAILDAIGLSSRDLFPDGAPDYAPLRSSPRPATRRTASKPKLTFPTAREAIAATVSRAGREPTTTWQYHGADGRLVGIVLRFDGPAGKTFRPVSLTDGGSWVCEGMPAPRPLYRLPAMLGSEGPIYVAEGEKAAEALVSLGLCATTSPNGSKSAGKADWSPMRGRRVVIVPDRDEPGERYADNVADLARDAGAESVVVVRLTDHWPDLPGGGDAADWIEHHDAAEPADLRHAIETLVAAAEPAAADDPADDAVIEWAPFPTEKLPASLTAFVVETAHGIGCDESMVALPLLAALAGAIGNARAIEARPGWREPAVLWTATVAESGSGKTPAFKSVMQFTDRHQRLHFEAHALQMAAHETAEQRYEAELTRWKKNAAGDPPEKPERPAARRLMVSDTTVEALVPILQANPRGVLVAVDELAGLIQSFDAYKPGGRGGADRSKWLSMHSAGSVTVDRKSSGTISVPSAAVSVCGGVQPATLVRTMKPDDVEAGLLGRLLLAMPPRRKRSWTTEAVGFSTQQAVSSLFDCLFAIPMPVEGPKVLDLCPDARTHFKEFWEEHEHQIFTSSGPVRSMLAKAEAAVVRLALVLHVARQAAGETLPDRIDADSMERGIALGRWFAREGRRVYGMLLGGRAIDRAADDASAAEKWVAARGGAASLRDLRKGLRRFRGDDDRAEQAARRLVAEGRATWNASRGGGRPADGLRLAPKPR
jgi:hypothetical protein